jgi:hypothetical protein
MQHTVLKRGIAAHVWATNGACACNNIADMIDLLHLLPFAQVSSSTMKEAAQPAVLPLQLQQQQLPSQKATCHTHSRSSSSNAVITLTPLLLMHVLLRGPEEGLCLPLLLLHLRPALERL